MKSKYNYFNILYFLMCWYLKIETNILDVKYGFNIL